LLIKKLAIAAQGIAIRISSSVKEQKLYNYGKKLHDSHIVACIQVLSLAYMQAKI
jgi:hypothetical protein